MTRGAGFLAALVLASAAAGAAAQPAEPALSELELHGRNLFNQSCVVCHVRMQITTAGHFGPPLSKTSLGGQDDIMREVISNGTPNMPGFKYHFKPDQIDAVVAYLKTLPTPATVAPPAPAAPH